VVTLEEFRPELLNELVAMWRKSFEHGVGITDPHSIEEQCDYFQNEVQPKNSVCVAMDNDQVAGFVAANHESVAQLFVNVDYLRRGIGTQLLDWAKQQSAGSLWLYTFARNTAAQSFYERANFKIVAQGFEETWQLDDIKYAWSRGSDADDFTMP